MGIKALLKRNISKYSKNIEELEFKQRRLGRILVRLRSWWPDIESCPSQDKLNKILENVKSIWNKNKNIESIDKTDLEYIPWVLFAGPKPWLGEDEQFCKKFSEYLISFPHYKIIIRLISSLLYYYPADISTFPSWMHTIEYLLNKYHKSYWRLKIWYERHNRWNIFKINAPRIIADNWLREPTEKIFFELGIADANEHKFAHQVLKEIINNVNRESKKGNYYYIVGLISVLSKSNFIVHNDSLKKDIINSLLGPFIESEPPSDIRKIIIAYLLSNFGDPRFEVGYWQEIDDTLIHIIKKWLSLESFNLFLDIIEKTSDPRFERRKKFWTYYFHLGYVIETWPILGKKAQREILQKISFDKDTYQQKFGLLINNDVRQSVLLLKISDLIIAEWSHNGKCRIWHGSNPNAPFLYKEIYTASELREKADYEKVHHGRWEYYIANMIHEYTNIKHPILGLHYDTSSKMEEQY